MARINNGRSKKTEAPRLMSRGHGLGAIRSVPSFRDTINAQAGLTLAERRRLIEQSAVLFRELYTHLPLKRAMHSIDPLQRLRLLEQRAAEPSIIEFHAELLDIFKELRDLHTNYSLPAPFGTQIAFLGILVEQYVENGQRKWMVSKVAEHLVTTRRLSLTSRSPTGTACRSGRRSGETPTRKPGATGRRGWREDLRH